MNAISAGLVEGLIAAMSAAEKDERINAIVITVAGNAFCAANPLRPQESFPHQY